MKTTGVIRKLDELGRIVIPIEQRRALDLDVHDPVEISMEDGKLVLKKYHTVCIFCGSSKDLSIFKEKPVCRKCLAGMKAM